MHWDFSACISRPTSLSLWDLMTFNTDFFTSRDSIPEYTPK